ncbi:unnamed protein product [Dimorphilus gyrociliatus]|uniref:SSD domain-containing protein n=1 Tax=Dimorphilus gyrociliatus TaxID=2664684 RepID=A0A7I8VF24_9ANNE|nr:unnamed protein product [Dimorphilus gyrociliatus]
MVWKTTDNTDIFTTKNLKTLCEATDIYYPLKYSASECPAQSLGSFIARLRMKSCSQINDNDVRIVKHLMSDCSIIYFGGHWQSCSKNATCRDQSIQCFMDGRDIYLFKMFHYFTDNRYLADKSKVTYAQVIGNGIINKDEYFNDLLDGKIVYKNLNLAGLYMDNRINVFLDYMKKDLLFIGVGGIAILFLTAFYVRSLAVMISTLMHMIFSFLLAYFLYHIIVGVKFFPFMNLLCLLILIAIGADDVFIFFDAWSLEFEREKTITVEKLLKRTLKHAMSSITVTSLTTATAFFACYVSHITAIKCFGIFCGIAVLCNLFFMITWIPPIAVVLHCMKKCDCKCPKFEILTRVKLAVFAKFLPNMVIKFRHFFIIFFALIGMFGFIFTFYKPKLQLPTSENFQLLPKTFHLEAWFQTYEKKFQNTQNSPNVIVEFLYGVKPIDNGDSMEPGDNGTLVFNNLDFYGTEFQNHLLKFCQSVRKQPWARLGGGECSVEYFYRMIQADCKEGMFEAPCCGQDPNYMNRSILEHCFPQMTKGGYFIGNALYTLKSTNIKAYRIIVNMSDTFTFSFKGMATIYDKLDKFWHENGNKDGFFSSMFFDFYDLQLSLSTETFQAMAVSLAMACAVMFITTFNILITLLAILTIACAIFVTVGSLVLAGWQLNILESVAISLAVGLSIDFAIHYGVAFQLSRETSRIKKTHESFTNISSAVSMAALSTFLAGVLVLPSKVYAYFQLGLFLTVVMIVSWIYATFFFQSLCATFGPENNFMQLPIFGTCKENTNLIEDSENRSTARTSLSSGFNEGADVLNYEDEDDEKKVNLYESV